MIYDLIFRYQTIKRRRPTTVATTTELSDHTDGPTVSTVSTVDIDLILSTPETETETTTRLYGNFHRRTSTFTTEQYTSPTTTTTPHIILIQNSISSTTPISELETNAPELTTNINQHSTLDLEEISSTTTSKTDSQILIRSQSTSEENLVKHKAGSEQNTTIDGPEINNNVQSTPAVVDSMDILNENVFEAVVSSPRPFGLTKRTRPIVRYTSTSSTSTMNPVEIEKAQPKVSSIPTIVDPIVNISIINIQSAYIQKFEIENQIDDKNNLTQVSLDLSDDHKQDINQNISDNTISISNVNITNNLPKINDLQSIKGISLIHNSNSNESGSDLTLSEQHLTAPLFVNQRHWYTTQSTTASPNISIPSPPSSSTEGVVTSTIQTRLRQRRPSRKRVEQNAVSPTSTEKNETRNQQPRRRYRPRIENIHVESNEINRSAVNRTYRPTSESELSSLTSIDFNTNNYGRRNNTSRRVWPTRRVTNQTKDDSSTTQDKARSRPTRPTAITTSYITTIESTEKPRRTRPTRIRPNSSEDESSSKRRIVNRYNTVRELDQSLSDIKNSTETSENISQTANSSATIRPNSRRRIIQSKTSTTNIPSVSPSEIEITSEINKHRRPLGSRNTETKNITFLTIQSEVNQNLEQNFNKAKARTNSNRFDTDKVETNNVASTENNSKANNSENSPIIYINKPNITGIENTEKPEVVTDEVSKTIDPEITTIESLGAFEISENTTSTIFGIVTESDITNSQHIQTTTDSKATGTDEKTEDQKPQRQRTLVNVKKRRLPIDAQPVSSATEQTISDVKINRRRLTFLRNTTSISANSTDGNSSEKINRQRRPLLQSSIQDENETRRRTPIYRLRSRSNSITESSSDETSSNENKTSDKANAFTVSTKRQRGGFRPTTEAQTNEIEEHNTGIVNNFDDNNVPIRIRQRLRYSGTTRTGSENTINQDESNLTENEQTSEKIENKKVIVVRKPVYRRRTTTTTEEPPNEVNIEETDDHNNNKAETSEPNKLYRLTPGRRTFGNRFKSTTAVSSNHSIEDVAKVDHVNNDSESSDGLNYKRFQLNGASPTGSTLVTRTRKVYRNRINHNDINSTPNDELNSNLNESEKSNESVEVEKVVETSRRKYFKRPTLVRKLNANSEQLSANSPPENNLSGSTVLDQQTRRRTLFNKASVPHRQIKDSKDATSTQVSILSDEDLKLEYITTTLPIEEINEEDSDRRYATESLISLFDGIDLSLATEPVNTITGLYDESTDSVDQSIIFTPNDSVKLENESEQPKKQRKNILFRKIRPNVLNRNVNTEASTVTSVVEENGKSTNDNLRQGRTQLYRSFSHRENISRQTKSRINEIDTSDGDNEHFTTEPESTTSYWESSDEDSTDTDNSFTTHLPSSTKSRLFHGHGLYKPTKPHNSKEFDDRNDDDNYATSHRPYVRKYLNKFVLPKRPNEEENTGLGDDYNDPNLIRNLKPIVRESTESSIAPLKQHRYKLKNHLKETQQEEEEIDIYEDDEPEARHRFVPLKPVKSVEILTTEGGVRSSFGKNKVANSPLYIPKKANNNKLHLTTIHPASLRQFEHKQAQTTEPTTFNRNKNTIKQYTNNNNIDESYIVESEPITEINDTNYEENTTILPQEDQNTSISILNSLNLVDNLQATANRVKSKKTTTTTTQKPTTFHHIFAIDYDEHFDISKHGQSKPNENNVSVISKRVEKLAEVNRIVEVYSQHQKHKIKSNKSGEKSQMSNLIIERLPTVNKIGEISRITLIKLIDRQNDSSSSNPDFVTFLTAPVTPKTEDSSQVKHSYAKTGRNIVLPESIFSVETSTIPLEGLFQTDRNGKNVNIIYASSPEQAAGSYTNYEQSTESRPSPVYVPISSATATTAKSIVSESNKRQPGQLPYSKISEALSTNVNDTVPLVITVANVDNVVVSKIPSSSIRNDSNLVSSVKVSQQIDESIDVHTTDSIPDTTEIFVDYTTNVAENNIVDTSEAISITTDIPVDYTTNVNELVETTVFN